MTRDEFKKFLTHGAICAEPGGDLRIFVGPFQRSEKRQASEISLFCTDFFLTESRPWWVPEKSFVITRAEFTKLCQAENKPLLEGHLGGLDWKSPDKNLFAPVFQDIQRDIKAGELGKAVPVVFEKASSETGPSLEDKGAWLCSLASLPESLFPYGVWDETYLMMGATPELLFQRKKPGAIETMALAGTLPKSEQGERVSLLDDPKEMEEHQFVVSDIRARLESLGDVQAHTPEILELPTLYHLCTRMEVADVGRPPRFEDLIRTLHPTPALGLYPRESNWTRLQSYSLGPRRAFGAPFGVYIDDNDFRCWVAIRNIQWYEGYLWLGSGCGVVRQSELDREWKELSAKRNSVKHMLGMDQNL